MKSPFQGKIILVTGGTGSIGSEIVKQLLDHKPDVIRIFDNNESGLFSLGQRLKEHKNIRTLVGDVRDKERLKRAMENVNIVFHAAAFKHVPLCEYNPLEAVQTNVIGTKNVIEVCLEEKSVELVINISTDKAVNPINTMGATKLLTEKLTTWASFYRKNRKPVFASVRFGNVINSSGSVIPTFKKQIEEGGPVTVTDTEMKRFVMSLNDATKLVLNVAKLAKGGETFVLKMPVIKIIDLAEAMIEKLASRYGHNPKQIKTKIIGLRGGERINEYLMTKEEMISSKETDDVFIILPSLQFSHLKNEVESYPGAKPVKYGDYSTETSTPISKKEILKILDKERV